ncbi:DUF2589 domain-containing protein [Hallella faecis]|uniref:DUF2589 domain-containing protein n=1 Tax=Hallella faecis TaxID=2841596 RepID=UPI003F8DD740
MPDGTNTNASRQVVSALNSIPFGNIIGGPLAACVQAQAEAAQTTLNYIRGFTMTESHLDVEGAEPITVSFSFLMEGVPTRMTVPLMTIVPIPYMRIEHVDLSFTADITACDNEKMEAKFASEGYQDVEEDEKSVSMQSKMGVHVRASTGDIPSGMAKMLDFFANNLVVQETLTTKEVEDMKLEAARQRAIRKNDMVEKERIEAQQALERQKQKEEERKKKEAEDKYRYGLIVGLVQGVKKRKLRLAEEELKRILRVIEEEEARCNKIAALVEAVKKRRERLDEEEQKRKEAERQRKEKEEQDKVSSSTTGPYIRPSTGSSSSSSGTYVRPSTSGSSSSSGSTSGSGSSSSSSSGTYVRPSTGSSSSSSGTYVRPSTGSSSTTGQYVRPSTGSSSSSSGTYVRPSTGSSSGSCGSSSASGGASSSSSSSRRLMPNMSKRVVAPSSSSGSASEKSDDPESLSKTIDSIKGRRFSNLIRNIKRKK